MTFSPSISGVVVKPIRIGFVTVFEAADRAQYSGIAYSMRESLKKQKGIELIDIDRLSTQLSSAWRVKQALYRYGFRKSYSINRQPFVARSYAAQVRRKCETAGGLDALLSPGSIPLALYAGPLPAFFWADATFAAMTDFYPQAKNLSNETVRNGNRLESTALANCCKAIYSSDWAARSAVNDYHAPAAKVHVVPYGSNFDTQHSEEDVLQFIKQRQCTPLELLFIGVDWERKRGDLAVAAADALVQRGHKVTLHAVGDIPKRKTPAYVVAHGFLSKKTDDGRERLAYLFRRSHALLLPTKADCSPIVIPEAYAYGLPVIATDVGGVSTSVKTGLTGRLMPLDSLAESWAEAVLEICGRTDTYTEYSLSAFRFYRTELNWDVTTRRVVDLIRAALGEAALTGNARENIAV
jgi:glycosyltransferase involved in cell wall biosynthesis